MPDARLEVTDALGRRIVPISKSHFEIGRRETNDLRLAGSEVSRDHAEIDVLDNSFLIRDKNSRYGTYVNGEQITERQLAHGDRVRLGRTGGAEMVFLLADSAPQMERATTTAIGDLRQIAALLEGLRALGSGRVLDDVLALVLDSAIEVSSAERGFIMLEGDTEVLEFKMARSRGRASIPAGTFATSRKIPEEVFRTGEPRIVADLLDGDLANVHMGTVALGIRNVLCVPLRLVRYLDRAEAVGEERRIGVLYLDSREKGSLLSNSTRAALETLATEAAVAIENARLYEAVRANEIRLEKEVRFAQRVQAALLPAGPPKRMKGVEMAACFAPARELGGDFHDYLAPEANTLVVAVGDVSGKGVPAALYSVFAAELVRGRTFRRRYLPERSTPASVLSSVNTILQQRQLEEYYCTMCYAIFDLKRRVVTLANSGLPYPIRCSGDVCAPIELPGVPLGSFQGSTYDEISFALHPGDLYVFCTDGVSEAMDINGQEFTSARLRDVVANSRNLPIREVVDTIFAAVEDFRRGAPANDDMTAVAVRITG